MISSPNLISGGGITPSKNSLILTVIKKQVASKAINACTLKEFKSIETNYPGNLERQVVNLCKATILIIPKRFPQTWKKRQSVQDHQEF
ncbi:hypothetical protein CEXT_395231 [Caerostris extrusa]|uniref:Uncharacterized protein n=1 Tax=Caerostris extrusa TaxID=172846 RepID=A0AAV4WAP3_CAEEX|nr:hypothetical protein CEXT_395231 [Caerostris extrusa]